MEELSNLVFLNRRLYAIFWNYLKGRGPEVTLLTPQEQLFTPFKVALANFNAYHKQPKRYYGIRFNRTDIPLRELILDKEDHYIIEINLLRAVRKRNLKILNEKKDRILNQGRNQQ